MTASERIRAARSNETRNTSDYLSQRVNFGGEWMTIGELYQRHGETNAARWLQGYEHYRNTHCTCGAELDENGEHDGGYGAWCS